MTSPERAIADALDAKGGWRAGHTADVAQFAVNALREAGWHLVSTPEFTDTPAPPDEPWERATLSVGVMLDHLDLTMSMPIAERLAGNEDVLEPARRWLLERLGVDIAERLDGMRR